MIKESSLLISKDYSKWLTILISVYIFSILSTTVLANRTTLVEIFGVQFLWPGGMFAFPIMFVILDIITETYGYNVSRVLIVSGIVMQFLFALLGIFVTHLNFPESFKNHEHYRIVFEPTLWYVFASSLGAMLSMFINSELLFKWKKIYKGNHYILRSILSSGIGQIILSFFVLTMMFYSSLEKEEIFIMTLSGWIYKMICIAILALPSEKIVNHLKFIGIDFYSSKVTYNPFLE